MRHIIQRVTTPRLAFLAALVTATAVALPAQAVVYTWNADAAGNWSDADNWDSTPDGYPNDNTADAQFILGLSAYRTVTLTEDIEVNAIRFHDTNGNNDNLIVHQGTGYTITFSGTDPTIASSTGANRGLDIQAAVDITAAGLTKTGTGVARLEQAITGDVGDNLTLAQGSIELRRDSPNFSGDIIVESGTRFQARSVAGTGAYVLGNTTGATIINGTGQFTTRDTSGKTISEDFILNGIRSTGSIKCYAGGDNTINGSVTLNNDSSFSVSDWTNMTSNVIGNKRDFYIDSVIAEGSGGPHDAYFLTDLGSNSYRGLNGRFSEIYLGAVNTYDGDTYLTTNYADDGTGTFIGNLRLNIDNALPTGTTLTLGGSHVSGSVTVGTGAGSGKFALGGHSQELAGLETAGTGSLNMVVGASTTLSTLTLNIASGTTNTYNGYLGYADFIAPTDTADPLYGTTHSETNRDNLALVKSGDGTLELTQNNTYSGGTTVSDGVLQTTATGALGPGAITVNSGAHLQLDAVGTYSIANPMTLAGSGAAGHGAVTSRASGADVTLTGAITLSGSTVIKAWGDGTTRITLSGGVDGSAGNHSLTLYRDNGHIVVDTNPVNLGTGSLGGGFDLNVAGNVASRLYSQWNQTVNVGADNPFTAAPAVELGNDSGSNGYSGRLDLNGHTFTASRLAETTTNAAGSSYVTDSTGGGTFILNNASGETSTYTGRFTGNLALTKQGEGTLVLSGNSTYTGTTTVSEGVLRITNAAALGNTAGNTTVVGTGAMVELEGDITVAEPITINGYGVSWRGALSSLSGTNTYSGPITVAGTGRIGVRTADTFTITGGITGTGTPQFVGTSGSTIRIATNPINVNGSLSAADNSVVLLDVGGNTWGSTTINYGGTIKLGLDDVMPTGTVVSIGSTNRNTNGTLDLNGHSQTIAGLQDFGTGDRRVVNTGSGTPTLTVNNTDPYTYAGVLGVAGQDSFALTKTGTGTFELGAANTYQGTTTVQGGTLRLGASQALGTGDLTVDQGATLDIGAHDQTVDALRLVDGTIDGTGTLTLSATSFLTKGVINASLAGNLGTGYGLQIGGDATATVELNGYNTYTSGTFQTLIGFGAMSPAGTVKLGNPHALGDAANQTYLYSGTLDLNGQADVATASIRLWSGGATLINSDTLNAASTDATVWVRGTNGDIGGPGDLTIQDVDQHSGGGNLHKIGAGTLTITGNAVHTGTTTVSGGTLALQTAGTNNIASSAQIIVGEALANSAAVLDVTGVLGGFQLGASQTLSGFGTVLGDLTVLGTHAPGASPGVQIVTGNYTNSGVLQIEVAGTGAGTGYDQVLITGASDYDVTLGGTLELIFDGSGWSSPQNNLWIINNETNGDLLGVFSNHPDNGSSVATHDGRTWYLYYEADFASGLLAGGNDVLLTAVPEPSTLAMLLGLASVGLIGYLRRRRQG